MKILITAFGAFPEVQVNPSEKLLREFQNLNKLDYQIYKEYLPVDYNYCRQWISSLNDSYDLIIHLGIARNTLKNMVELKAHNYCGANLDILGVSCEGKISESQPEFLSTALSFNFLNKQKNGMVIKSDDAGDYLCNFIYFKSLERQSLRKVLFYHLAPEQVIATGEQEELLSWLLQKILEENFS